MKSTSVEHASQRSGTTFTIEGLGVFANLLRAGEVDPTATWWLQRNLLSNGVERTVQALNRAGEMLKTQRMVAVACLGIATK